MKRLLLFVLLMLMPLSAHAAWLEIVPPESVTGFTENVITVRSDTAGVLLLSLQDEQGEQYAWQAQIAAGENRLVWDGLRYHGEPIDAGAYILRGELSAAGQTACAAESAVTLLPCRNALLFALRCSDRLYTQAKDPWFCEMALARTGGTVLMEIRRADAPEKVLMTKSKRVEDSDPARMYWDGTIDGVTVADGEYRLILWEADNPAYYHETTVTVTEGKEPVYDLELSPMIIPERGMTDAEIWRIMQRPSVVADIGQTAHLTIRADKGKGKALGTVHGQSQSLMLLHVEDGFAFVGVWNHETGDYVEGWVKAAELKVVVPNREYGLLIDKQTQTMTVYYKGTVLDTISISTGLAAVDRMIRETPAGAYQTVNRIGSFDSEGYHYEYVIRYDGGNLIHQMGYDRVGGKKDFSDHVGLLGAKASHGCVRVSDEPGANGINAFWLYTHLPYGTRVIILDDPENRILQAAAAGEKVTVPMTAPVAPPALAEDETELVLTVGGDVVLGTRESWWERSDALPAHLSQHGLTYPFSGLQTIFQQDDMTFVNLECVLKEDNADEDKDKLYRFRGLPEWAEGLAASSIEQVSIANNHYVDYGEDGQHSTLQALEASGVAYSGFENMYIWEQDGQRIGFGGCRETVYKKDPSVVYKDVNAMKRAGCDVIIYTCHWGTEYEPNHNDLQERIAAAAAAAGADIILGGHPHVVQGVGTVEHRPVLYSLGNLMFGGTIELDTFDGMLAQLRLRFDAQGYKGCTVRLIPVLTSGQAGQQINDYRPVIAEGADRERILQKVQDDTAFPLLEEMYFPVR